MACTKAMAPEEPRRAPPDATVVPGVPSVRVRAAARPLAAPMIAPLPSPAPAAPVSGALRNPKLHDPMPGGFLGGWHGDTGLDISGDRLEVYALAAGTLDYAEWGHTRWTRPPDTAYSVRIAFDEPIPWGEHRITHAYYTHLSKVEAEVKEGSANRKHVAAGERIGVSGIGNGTPHLHLGLLLDGEVEQDSWTYILREGDIRKVMGGYANGARLPLSDAPRRP
jgi:hypothetical protein